MRNINRIQREIQCATLTVVHTGWADDTRNRIHTDFCGSFDTRMKVEGHEDSPYKESVLNITLGA